MTIRTAGLCLAATFAALLADTAFADPTKPSSSGASVPDPMTTGALPTPQPLSVTVGSDGSKTIYYGRETPAQPVAAIPATPTRTEDAAAKAEAPTAAKPADSAVASPPSSAPAAAKPTATAATEAGASVPEKPAESAVAAPAAPPPANPVIEALRAKLSDKSLAGKDISSQDLTAIADFYGSRAEPLWVKGGSFNAHGKEIISTLKKADDWGLESSDFVVPDLAAGASADQQAEAEARLTLMAMKYARFARGGRLDPVSLSNILDMKPPVKDSKTVMAELSAASAPGTYLTGLNPKHDGFQKLRAALLKARGPSQDDEAIDPALQVKLPDAKPLKPGTEDDEVPLLRKRLKVAAATTDAEQLYDDTLVDAVKDVQKANGMKANGVITNRLRAVLNKEGEPKRVDPKRETDRIIANMERWRWLPENLGAFYVMNNIPEFTSEIWKGDQRILKQKMIVGQPSWPTPVMQADMTIVGTHPSWGMPPGIKMKELLPRVRAASGGDNFFDMLFGGGGSGAGSIIRAYKLQAFCNGRRVDPDQVTAENVASCGFTQPPGADNPLGIVKFRFPNRHDVYMHDTPERGLFAQSMRALSHGCMRVEEPKRTAEIILGEDKGWSAEKVEGLFAGSTEVKLDKPFPVYLVYFTARVGEDGRLDRYTDIYGHDDRIMSALRGRPVRYTAPEAVDPAGDGDEAKPMASNAPERTQTKRSTSVSDAGSDSLSDDAPPAKSKKSKNNKQTSDKRKSRTAGDIFTDAFSGGFLN